MTTLTTPAVFIDPRTDFVSTNTAALPTEAITLLRRPPTAGVALLLSELPAQALVVVWSDPE